MEIIQVKKGILNALKGILTDLTIKEIEDLQNTLSIQLRKLTDTGKRIKLADLKKTWKLTEYQKKPFNWGFYFL